MRLFPISLAPVPCRRRARLSSFVRQATRWRAAPYFLVLLVPLVAVSGEAIWDPPAVRVFPDHDAVTRGEQTFASLIEAGRTLFAAKFGPLDGAGRPGATGDSKPTPRAKSAAVTLNRIAGPDANSCLGCHNEPASGGSGDFAANVFVGAHFSDPPILSAAPEATNERNTTGIFGAGLIEMVAREMTRDLHRMRRQALEEAARTGRPSHVTLQTKGVNFGGLVARADGTLDVSRVAGVDADLVVKPFGAKGVAVSLREFTVFALNQHHGIQAIERFGWERTGRRDFDGDGVEVEMTTGQVSALVTFQASLAPPRVRAVRDAVEQQRMERGVSLFSSVGCASCHIPALPLERAIFSEPGPYNRPGALASREIGTTFDVPLSVAASDAMGERGAWVRAFTDLKRHRICDEQRPHLCNERRRQDNVPTDQFMTAKLWDLAKSAPYCHRGDCLTVSEAIMSHGGEAAASRSRFETLTDGDKRVLVAYLLTLGSDHPGER